MTDHAITQARVDIATLETKVEHLTQGMKDLRESNQALTAKLDQMLITMSEARGGWRTLMLVGGAASTMGAGLAWLFAHFTKGVA
jgi:hypothetical protein